MSELIHPLWLVVASILIAAAPIFIGVVTSYLKVSIVLGMLRNGLGTQQVPGGMIIMSLSLALTCFIMAPTIEETAEIASKIDITNLQKSAPNFKMLSYVQPLINPWKSFMQKHVSVKELTVLAKLSKPLQAESLSDKELSSAYDNLRILIPAFVLSELKQGFSMAFLVVLPFLVIDLVVANILAGLGMTMVSPVMISLPLKLILFVMSDGWLLLVKGLISSYQYVG